MQIGGSEELLDKRDFPRWAGREQVTRGCTWPGERVEIPWFEGISQRWKRESWERPENAQYPIFRSTQAAGGPRTPDPPQNICILGKGLFAFSETDANERVLPGWKDAKESRLCSAGPFCESFSPQRLIFSSYMMHLSCKQYPAISLSNSLVIRRGHCAPVPLSPFPASRPPALAPSWSCVLQNSLCYPLCNSFGLKTPRHGRKCAARIVAIRWSMVMSSRGEEAPSVFE